MHVIMWPLHAVVELLFSGALAIGVVAAVDLVLLLSWLGNPRALYFSIHIRRFIKRVSMARSNAVFSCQGNDVFFTTYDARTDEESTQKAYRGSPLPTFLTWSGGPRVAPRMRRAANSEVALHVCYVVLIAIPLVVIGIWLAAEVNWRWTFALVFFLEWQAICAYTNVFLYLKARFFTFMISSIFAQRMHWVHNYSWFGIHVKPPLWLSIVIICVFLYVPPLLFAGASRGLADVEE